MSGGTARWLAGGECLRRYNNRVPFTTNFQSSRIGKKQREAVLQALASVFAGKAGKWHVQFIGDGEEIEMRVSGPGVETSDLVDASMDPQSIVQAIARILPS